MQKGEAFMNSFIESGDLSALEVLYLESESDFIEQAQALEKKEISPLFKAIKCQETGIFKWLLSLQVFDKYVKSKRSETLLHILAKHGNIEDLNYLIETTDLPLSIKWINKTDLADNTPLHWALERGKFEFAKSLIDLGADIEPLDRYDRNAFMIAAMKGLDDEGLLSSLYPANMTLSLESLHGQTILHLAAIGNNEVVMSQMLLQAKEEDLQKKDYFGMTPLEVAIRYASDKCIFLLGGDLEFIKSTSIYGVTLPNLTQAHILNQCFSYLSLQKRKEHFLEEDGYCDGFQSLAGLYGVRGKLEQYFEMLSMISTWDGELSSLDRYLVLENDRENAQKLCDLFEQFIQDIIVLQRKPAFQELLPNVNSSFFKKQEFMSIKGRSWPKVSLLLEWNFNLNEKEPNTFINHFYKTPNWQLEECLLFFSKIPGKNLQIELSGSNHATRLFFNNQNQFIEYVEPNQVHRFQIHEIDTVVRLIKGYKYRLLGIPKEEYHLRFKVYQVGAPFEISDISTKALFSEGNLFLRGVSPAYMAILADLPEHAQTLWMTEDKLFYQNNKNDETALDLMFRLDRESCFLALLECSNEEQLLALIQIVIEKNKLELLKLIYESHLIGLDFDNIKLKNESLLIFAITCKKKEVVEWIIEQNLCLNVSNKKGIPPFLLCKEVSLSLSEQATDKLIQNLPESFCIEALIWTIKKRDVYGLSKLLAKFPDIDISQADLKGCSPLEYCLYDRSIQIFCKDDIDAREKAGNSHILERLIPCCGFDPDKVFSDIFSHHYNGWSRLFVMVREGMDCKEYLSQIDPNTRRSFLSTLFWDQEWDLLLMIQNDPEISFYKISNVILHYLAVRGTNEPSCQKLTEILISNSTELALSKKTNQGETPGMLAEKHENTFFLECISKYQRTDQLTSVSI